MIKNYLERRKALQKLFKETTEESYPEEIPALRIHRELVFPFRVLLITVCIAALIYLIKC